MSNKEIDKLINGLRDVMNENGIDPDEPEKLFDAYICSDWYIFPSIRFGSWITGWPVLHISLACFEIEINLNALRGK